MLKFIIGFLLIMGFLVHYDMTRTNNYTQLCESKGGKALIGRDLMACVKSDIVIRVDQ